MASVSKLPTGTWQVRWKVPGSRATRKKNFRSRAEALQFRTSIEHATLTGTYVDPRAGRITFKSYAEGWRSIQVHRPSTGAQVKANLTNHVYPRLGDRPIGSIRRSEVQALIADLNQHLAPATVELVYIWTASIFKCAVADRVIGVTPCFEIKLPRAEDLRVVPLPMETVEALINAVPPRYKTLIVLGAGTGVRISEALGLTSDRVDWMRRTMTIDRQLVRDGTTVVAFAPVKDRSNRPRVIPLPSTVHAALVEHVRVYGLGPDGLVFTNDHGRPVRRSAFSDMWLSAAGPLGIPKGEGYHLLRHFYASVLIRSGESVRVVQDRLGHTSPMITLSTYAHLWPEDDDSTRAALDSVLGEMGSLWGPSASAKG